jgi:hypothetical protein
MTIGDEILHASLRRRKTDYSPRRRIFFFSATIVSNYLVGGYYKFVALSALWQLLRCDKKIIVTICT